MDKVNQSQKYEEGTVRKPNPYILNSKSPFIMREAYKTLRTNIQFSLPGNGCKCIAITSSNREEGKSVNAINLAIAFGQIGKKVLLIDGDMRLPTIAEKLNIADKPGISDVLAGVVSVETAVQKPKTGTVCVLPAGNIPPDPTWLLESEQMHDLINRFRKEYDQIIIDLPPVTAVPDASIVSPCVDGFLLVVKHESSAYKDVSEMMNKLQFVKAKILGFIYTAAADNTNRYYSHHH